MERYYPFDIFSMERIEETATIIDGIIQLRHTPKYRSVEIDGFNETDSLNLLKNQFRVDYSLDTYYRESKRLLHFNPTNDGLELKISYITCGTVITADDMNEIKAHLDSDHAAFYKLPTASLEQKGGIRVGEGLYMTGDILNVANQNFVSFQFANALPAKPSAGVLYIIDGKVFLGTDNNFIRLGGD